METTRTLSRSATSAVSVYMRQVYGWMTVGLALTSVVAYATASSPAFHLAIFSNSLIPFVLILAQFGLVIALSAAIHKMSGTTATGLFLLYSGKAIADRSDPTYECRNLLVYDWNGNPVKRYELKNSISSIFISGDTVYGVTSVPNGAIYAYSLN